MLRAFWWIGQVMVVSLLLIVAAAWYDSAVNRQSCNLLVRVGGDYAVQVFGRRQAVSIALFSQRYWPARGPAAWFERAGVHTEAGELMAQREVRRSCFTGAWGIELGRLAVAGGWGDPAGRNNLLGVRTPLWLVLGGAGLAEAALWYGRTRRRRRWRAGRCPKCNYDLRGSGDHCPECGWPTRQTPAESRL